METIQSTTLPVGAFTQVDYDGITKKLYDGDMVIMVTDGVANCFLQDGENGIEEDVDRYEKTVVLMRLRIRCLRRLWPGKIMEYRMI